MVISFCVKFAKVKLQSPLDGQFACEIEFVTT